MVAIDGHVNQPVSIAFIPVIFPVIYPPDPRRRQVGSDGGHPITPVVPGADAAYYSIDHASACAMLAHCHVQLLGEAVLCVWPISHGLVGTHLITCRGRLDCRARIDELLFENIQCIQPYFTRIMCTLI